MKTIDEMEEGYARYRAISQIKPMCSNVKCFFRFCKRYSHDGYIRQEHADLWAVKREKESLNTNYTRVVAVKRMLDFARSKGWTDVKIDKNVRWYARPKKMIFLTTDEIAKFFKACDEYISTAVQIRNRRFRLNPLSAKVLFLLIYSAGLRPIEARMLSRSDVDLRTGVISIRVTKGYREHVVVMDDNMLRVMRSYDEVMERSVPGREAFFSKYDGSYFKQSWFATSFRNRWHKYNERSAVAYNFRHNYAIENINSWNEDGIENNYDKLLSLSRSMGHSKLAHTLYYYSLSPQYAQEIRRLSSENINKILHDIPNENEY